MAHSIYPLCNFTKLLLYFHEFLDISIVLDLELFAVLIVNLLYRLFSLIECLV